MSNSLNLDIPAGVPWIDFTREFDAPVAAVFDAHRDPDKVRQWLGPHGYEMVIDEWDFTTGGRYRYEHRTDHGDFGFRGVFHTDSRERLRAPDLRVRRRTRRGGAGVHVVRGPR